MRLLKDIWTVLKAHPYLLVMPICLVLYLTGDLKHIVNSTLERKPCRRS